MQTPNDSNKPHENASATDGEKAPFPTMPVVLAVVGLLLLVLLIVLG